MTDAQRLQLFNALRKPVLVDPQLQEIVDKTVQDQLKHIEPLIDSWLILAAAPDAMDPVGRGSDLKCDYCDKLADFIVGTTGHAACKDDLAKAKTDQAKKFPPRRAVL